MKIYVRLLALMVVQSCVYSGSPNLRAQAPPPAFAIPSDAEKASCAIHGMTDAQCFLLVQEFDSTKALKTTGQTILDNAYNDIIPLVTSLIDQAYARELSGQVKDKAKQEAVQLLSLEAANTQSGSTAGSSGSTNLTTKPTTTDFLSMAAESGAFTDTLNGNALTLQANANGLLKYFSNKPEFVRWNSKYASALQPLSFSVAVNVAQSGTTSAPVTGSAGGVSLGSLSSVILPANNTSFSSFTASYAIYRPYNPQDTAFATSWEAALKAHSTQLQAAGKQNAVAVTALLEDALKSPPETLSNARIAWHTAGTASENSGSFDEFVTAYAGYYSAFRTYLVSSTELASEVLAVNQASTAYQQAAQDTLDDARGHPLATISYTYSTPVQQPAVHEGTIVLSYLFKGTPQGRSFLTGAQFTGNFTGSVYASLPVGATYGRFRDVQLSAEFDKPFGGTKEAPRGVFSFAGYGQYQYDPTVLNITAGNLAPNTNITLPSNSQVLLGAAGWIGVTQAKVTINLSKGLTIPVAIKWSNRTDLLADSDIRGQFGLSYDLSALSSLLSQK